MYKILSIIFAICTVLFADASDKPHVVLFGIDGFTIEGLIESDMPNVKAEMNRGSWTFNKRSVLPSSSAPNWASMFMGTPPEIHGYTKWDSQAPDIPSPVELKNNIFPTIFQVLKNSDENIKTSCIYEWEGIKWLVDTISTDYFELARDYEKRPCSQLAEMAAEHLKSIRPDMFMIIFDWADHVGHAEGYDSAAYREALSSIDENIGVIIETMKELGYYEDTTFIITGDHGGINNSHGGNTLAEMESPFIISGKGISDTGEFYELMMQYDITATIADIFNIDMPKIWRGKSFLDMFEQGLLTSINRPRFSSKSIRRAFYDIQGRQLYKEPNRGLYLVTDLLSSGTHVTKKLIR